jgi:hypothetical protein
MSDSASPVNPLQPRTKDCLVLLRNVLTMWEQGRYDASRMELAELKQRIKNKILWIDEQASALEIQREQWTEKLKQLEDLETVEYEVENSEGIELYGLLDHRAYAGKTQEEAILAILGKSKSALSPRQITVMMKDGGYPFKTDDPLNAIYVLLNKLRKEGKVEDEKTTASGICFKLPEATRSHLVIELKK